MCVRICRRYGKSKIGICKYKAAQSVAFFMLDEVMKRRRPESMRIYFGQPIPFMGDYSYLSKRWMRFVDLCNAILI